MLEKKHAYLIVAHQNEWQLQKLLTMIDFPRNDIYLLFDRKSPLSQNFKIPQLFYSKLTVLEPINIFWGGG